MSDFMTARYVAMGILGVAVLVLVTLYFIRRRQIATFARSRTSETRTSTDAAFALGRAIFSEVLRRPDDPLFLWEGLRVLGASPRDVIRSGGCCSGTHRLYIAALHTLGIKAAQITVYNPRMPNAVHCLTQVTLDGGPKIIDVAYGVWYKHPSDVDLDLADLQRGIKPVIEPFADGLFATHSHGLVLRPGYPIDPYYDFDYSLTKTANWTESTWRHLLYVVLHKATCGRIDRAFLHPLLEWPELLLAIVLAIPFVLLVVPSLA